MSITRPLAAGGALATGVLVLLAASIALATDESPPPTGEPSVAPKPSATVEAQPSPLLAPEPTDGPTATPTVAPAATKAPAATSKPAASPEADEVRGPAESRTGVVAVRIAADGDREYVLDGVTLAVGPPWFWGTKHPLEPYVGKSVTVTGRMDDGKPSARARGQTRGSDGPEFDVYTVNGKTIRAEGKPPWAGGPRVVGERHPGFRGWSEGQANRAGNTTSP